MATDEDLYQIYLKAYGKVRSGTKLVNNDYFHHSLNGATPFTTDENLAVTMAADDVKNKEPMRARTEFLSELKRLLA